MRIRYGRLVQAAERIAAGDYTVAVSERGGGMEARLGVAINRISASLADTTDRATIDRMTGVVNRQALLAALFAEVERASRYERPLCVAFVDIDHFKVVNDSYGHAAGDVVLRGVAQTISENLRASDLIGRYGGEEFMLILTETTVEEGADAEREAAQAGRARAVHVVEGNQDLSVTISIGIVGGVGQAAPDGDPRPRRRCRDVLGEVARAATRPTSSRSPTRIRACRGRRSRTPGGRAPIEIGRQARQAATDMLTSFIAPAPPLPRTAVGAHRRDRGRDGPPAPAARRGDRPHPRRGAPPRRRQGRACPRPSSTSRRR